MFVKVEEFLTLVNGGVLPPTSSASSIEKYNLLHVLAYRVHFSLSDPEFQNAFLQPKFKSNGFYVLVLNSSFYRVRPFDASD